MIEAKDTVTYTLNCDNCEVPYNSKKAFPKPQFCPCCMSVYRAGIKEVVEWVERFGGLANKIEGEDPEYGYQIQYWACRDDLSPEEYGELKTIYRFVIEMSYDEWQSRLKEWGIEFESKKEE